MYICTSEPSTKFARQKRYRENLKKMNPEKYRELADKRNANNRERYAKQKRDGYGVMINQVYYNLANVFECKVVVETYRAMKCFTRI